MRSISQEQLGEAAQVGTSHVAHIEIGSRRPTLDVLLKIAAALDVPLWQLITDDRLTTDERVWDAAARDLAGKVRGLEHDDLQALSYLAGRLHDVRSVGVTIRAAERGAQTWRSKPRRRRTTKTRG